MNLFTRSKIILAPGSNMAAVRTGGWFDDERWTTWVKEGESWFRLPGGYLSAEEANESLRLELEKAWTHVNPSS